MAILSYPEVLQTVTGSAVEKYARTWRTLTSPDPSPECSRPQRHSRSNILHAFQSGPLPFSQFQLASSQSGIHIFHGSNHAKLLYPCFTFITPVSRSKPYRWRSCIALKRRLLQPKSLPVILSCFARDTSLTPTAASESTRARLVPAELVPVVLEVTLARALTWPCQPQEVEEDHTRLFHSSQTT